MQIRSVETATAPSRSLRSSASATDSTLQERVTLGQGASERELTPAEVSRMRSATLTGVSVGGGIGAALGSFMSHGDVVMGVVTCLCGALVGGCIAEENCKINLGFPVEIPSGLR